MIKDGFEIIVGIVTLISALIGMVWYVSEVKSSIFMEIDRVKDGLEKQFSQLDKRLDLHIQDSMSAREMINYQLQGQGNRIGGEVEQIKKRMSGLIIFEKLEEKIDRILDKMNNI